MFSDINEIDLRLKLLAGDSFSVGNIALQPLTLREVIDIGYIKYSQYLGILSYEIAELVDPAYLEVVKDMTLLDVVLSSGNEQLILMLLDAICVFTREDKQSIRYFQDHGLVLGEAQEDIADCKVLGKENFEHFLEILKLQNCISKVDMSDEYNVKSPIGKRIAEQLKRAKEIVRRAKKVGDGDVEIDFADLVSAVSTKSNTYNKHTIWDCTVYQFYDEYKRLEHITAYETNVLAMINGAKVELKHWCARIE